MAYNKTKDEVYWLERDGIAIAKANVSGVSPATEYTGPAAGKTVTIFAIKNDENFVASGTGIAMTESPAIPDEFHDALAQYAIMKGYETKPEAIQMAGYFRQQWEMCIREGKKYANTGRDGSSLSIKGYDY
jgi:hypothetical protein|tara:strand:+ start:8618 stop:9010 length:393 start_codon:yes stop_codon:yes gene_type:complete